MDLCQAIKNRNTIQFKYKELNRIVQPACYGRNKKGNDMLRGYQIRGDTHSESPSSWKYFKVDNIEDGKILNEKFHESPQGYKKGDKHMSEIYCEL